MRATGYKRATLPRHIVVIFWLFTVLPGVEAQSRPTFSVVTRGDTEDFVRQKADGTFEGYIYDILVKIEENLKVKFDVRMFTEANGTWDQMIQRTSTGEWDMAAGSFSITVDRLGSVIFSQGFFAASRSLVIQKAEHPHFMFLLQPFSMWLWLCLGGSLLLMGFGIYVAEHHKLRHYSDGMWFVAVLMFGPPNPHPNRSPTRITTVLWEFCFLVMVAAYTGKLASMLTVQRASHSINSFADVADEPVAVPEGGTHVLYAKERLGLMNITEVSHDAGIPVDRIYSGEFVGYIGGTTEIKMVVRKNCKLGIAATGDVHQYGFAFPKDRKLLEQNVSMAIVHLSQSGQLEALHKKWFPPPNCDRKDSDPFTPADFAGVFLLIIMGVAVCILSCLWSMFRKRWCKDKVRQRLRNKLHVDNAKKKLKQMQDDENTLAAIPTLLADQEKLLQQLQQTQKKIAEAYAQLPRGALAAIALRQEAPFAPTAGNPILVGNSPDSTFKSTPLLLPNEAHHSHTYDIHDDPEDDHNQHHHADPLKPDNDDAKSKSQSASEQDVGDREGNRDTKVNTEIAPLITTTESTTIPEPTKIQYSDDSPTSTLTMRQNAARKNQYQYPRNIERGEAYSIENNDYTYPHPISDSVTTFTTDYTIGEGQQWSHWDQHPSRRYNWKAPNYTTRM